MHQGFYVHELAGRDGDRGQRQHCDLNFTRVRKTRSVSGGVYVADEAITVRRTALDRERWNAECDRIEWRLAVEHRGWLARDVDRYRDQSGLHRLLRFPQTLPRRGRRPHADFLRGYSGRDAAHGFTSSGANSDDTVGTVGIPVVMTLPAGLTNWPRYSRFLTQLITAAPPNTAWTTRCTAASSTFTAACALAVHHSADHHPRSASPKTKPWSSSSRPETPSPTSARFPRSPTPSATRARSEFRQRNQWSVQLIGPP